jgi:DNA-binding response OmpR family regulator
LVDDDDALRRAVRRVLEHAGYTVFEAREGGQALTLSRTESFDLVITDLVMPGREGLETIRALRAAQPDLAIIAISGARNVEDYLKMAKLLGAAATIQKPFETAHLLAAIAETVARAKPTT